MGFKSMSRPGRTKPLTIPYMSISRLAWHNNHLQYHTHATLSRRTSTEYESSYPLSASAKGRGALVEPEPQLRRQLRQICVCRQQRPTTQKHKPNCDLMHTRPSVLDELSGERIVTLIRIAKWRS
ncbi:uncharacterized protein STEHIDRAFT_146588 [Stereum hirsutum FP-91666 SS1]|uniref:uncharacterized protein n=1 Tax=Stereum hirsutum (strain FP-91666) TaxID=721885 RepID=UPI0004410704|nr:uncharacterized protein STEHIDRAFT_146588 [Stereum hirsutum FP-91666 SS1]EIM86993.1 hypothetical protein STEHIDRAFT_146588 [Stereum hirsutum FP-91666 SS1]